MTILDKFSLPYMRALRQATHIIEHSFDLNKVRNELLTTLRTPFSNDGKPIGAEKQSAGKD